MKSHKYINPYNPRHLADLEKSMKEVFQRKGKPINIYICELSETRTLTQNRYYWSLMQMIGDEIGDHRNEVHKFMKGKFLKKETISIKGFDQEAEQSTADLNTKQMADYVDNIIKFAQDFLNITLPRPREVPIEVYIETINR
jgi:hypothetical protein